MDDQSVAQRVLDHIANGTTDVGEEVWREPVANYQSKERLAAEIERVLRRSPTPFCPAAALPEVGSYIARDAAGTPIVVVRGVDGKVRAFRNACRHRGMQVASDSGCTRAFVCRYHGWTYNLEGRLRHIPHEAGFPGFDKEAHPLVPMTASERFGLVFVTQDEPALGDNSLGGLDKLISPDQRLFATAEREFEVNWKILLEGFIEGYHIKSTHPESFLPYGFDNLNVIDLFGSHSRVTYPFQRIKKLAKVAAGRAPGRRPADLRLSPVPQRADHGAVAPHQRGDPRAAWRRSHAADHLHADQRRRRRSGGAGRSQARRRLRRQHRRAGGPCGRRRRSSAASAAAPTTPSPSATTKAPSSTSTRR